MYQTEKQERKYQVLSWCAKNLDMFVTKFKNGGDRKPLNLKEFRRAEKRKLILKLNHQFNKLEWFLDLTSRSVVAQRMKTRRAGRYEELGYVVLYNVTYKFGYAIEQPNNYRNIEKRKLIKLLAYAKITELIATDKRHAKISNIITVPKKFTRQIDCLFGFKNGLYKHLTKNTTEAELDRLYEEYFRRLNIQLIH